MPRTDLLSLTADDLTVLTNRGAVKRAHKELEAGEPSCQISDDDNGEVIVAWSDGITCRFPAGRTVHDAICSSGLAGISRHVVRSVLAYQLANPFGGDLSTSPDPLQPQVESDMTGAPLSELWDPGRFSDDDLVARFRKAAVTKARKRFEQGVLVELTRGAKPTARFLDEACTLRFMVPGDLRYVSADCAESLLPTWVPLAVWSFRELPDDRVGGLLCLQQAELPTPQSVLDNLDELLDELYRDGMAGLSDSWVPRLSRVEQVLRNEGLVWPAELVVDLLHQHDMYAKRDARFEPLQLVAITGELTARTRAIVEGNKSVPQPLIRGTKSDRATDIARCRMIGVGLGVRPGKHHATLSAYLQDADSGGVVAVERTFADPDPNSGEQPRSFAELSATVLVRGVSLARLASSQLLLKSGKRSPSGRLVLPRTASSYATNPQTFQWEQLKPPFAAETFQQLAARFESLPPSYLRPRRTTENLHVVATRRAEGVQVDGIHQRLTAVIHDLGGETALLIHPFHSRGLEGFDELLDVLEKRGDDLRFVCGHVRSRGRTAGNPSHQLGVR